MWTCFLFSILVTKSIEEATYIEVSPLRLPPLHTEPRGRASCVPQPSQPCAPPWGPLAFWWMANSNLVVLSRDLGWKVRLTNAFSEADGFWNSFKLCPHVCKMNYFLHSEQRQPLPLIYYLLEGRWVFSFSHSINLAWNIYILIQVAVFINIHQSQISLQGREAIVQEGRTWVFSLPWGEFIPMNTYKTLHSILNSRRIFWRPVGVRLLRGMWECRSDESIYLWA